MIYHIITNSKIYLKYKEDVLSFNTRLFDANNFLDILNYKDPIDLTGMKEYLNYTDIVEIDSLSTFFDYINIILILNFLNENDYKGIININYINLYKDNYKEAKFLSKKVNNNDNIKLMFENLTLKKKLDNLIDIPGANTFINFYNNLLDKELFMSLNDEELDEYDSIDDKAKFLEDKYSEYELDFNYFYNYLKEYYD